jgi:hypothetical protein
MRPSMNHTHRFTSLTWGLWRRADVVPANITFDRAHDEEDDCEAVFVEDLEPEWLEALKAADYSHLRKKKITA